MDKQILNFTVNEQILVCENPIKISTNKVNYIQASFDLGENWDGFDSVRAVWFNDFNCISTVLDSLGNCVVPFEVLKRKGNVKINLVGSISEDDVLTDRLTSYPVVAVIVDCTAQITGANTSPITPSEIEQFAQRVHTDAERAEAGASASEQSATESANSASASAESAQEAEAHASSAQIYAGMASNEAEASANSASEAQTYAQNASESATDAEGYAEDAESARDTILGMRATANTLSEGSDATASYSNGLLTLGIPRGNTGATGPTGPQGETGATPNLSIGNVETLEPNESATATIGGTAENPILSFGIPKGDTGEVSQAELDEAVTDLKSAISDNTDTEQIQFSDPSARQYINTGGATVDWSTPSTSSTINYKYAVVECEEGDVFTISGKGGNSGRLWAFADASKNLLDPRAGEGVTEHELVITAPANSAYLIINDQSDSNSYIGEVLADRVTKNKTQIYDLKDALTSLGQDVLSKAISTQNAYVLSTGGLVESSNWISYVFKVDDIVALTHIESFCSSNITYLQIAYYSSETISAETFITGISFQTPSSKNTVNHLLTPPSNASVVVVTNRQSTGSAVIYGVEYDLIKRLEEDVETLKTNTLHDGNTFDAFAVDNENGSLSGQVGSAITIGTQDYWKHIEVSVTEGDIFRITYKTSTNANPYVFLTDSDDVITNRYAENTSGVSAVRTYIVTIPSGVSKLYARSYEDKVKAEKQYKVSEVVKSLRNNDTKLLTDIFALSIKGKNRMLFSAHRGAEGQAPYGSYPSYELACVQSWDMIQIASARQSVDGTWYCLHDETVDAQTNGTGAIASLTDSYIASIYQDVGENISDYTTDEMKLPTLKSILQLAYRYGVKVSIRLGSLPTDISIESNRNAWDSFIALCGQYSPQFMMFSGSFDQITILKKLTDNWHGNIYITADVVIDAVDQCVSSGFTNLSIMANKSFVSEETIAYIHQNGYMYMSSQISEPTIDDFIELSDWGCDIAQTGVSDIHSLDL